MVVQPTLTTSVHKFKTGHITQPEKEALLISLIDFWERVNAFVANYATTELGVGIMYEAETSDDVDIEEDEQDEEEEE